MKQCVICGASSGLTLWTLDNQKLAGMTYLCDEHGAPLQEVLDATEGQPPQTQRPLIGRPAPEEDTGPEVKGRKLVMEPLDWTPPS